MLPHQNQFKVYGGKAEMGGGGVCRGQSQVFSLSFTRSSFFPLSGVNPSVTWFLYGIILSLTRLTSSKVIKFPQK